MNKRNILVAISIIVLFCLTLGLKVAAWADDLNPTAADADSYAVEPDDVLSITVIGFTDLTQPQVVVLRDGSVSLPLIGAVNVEGQTPEQIQQTLANKWKKYVINPSVTVALLKKHPEFISFEGFVLHPGTIDYRPNFHVCDALAEAGGALVTGDLSKVTVTDSSGTKKLLDLSHPDTKAGTNVDVVLNVDDVVFVPQLRDEITVVGEVKNPGSYPYLENETVMDALTTVGGTLEEADLSDAKLLHNGQEAPINLDALLRHGDLTQNIKLSAGDRITVPEGNRTYVYGAVSKPGYYTFKPGDTILDAFNAAGGPAPAYSQDNRPDLAKVNLIRVDKAANKATMRVVDFQKFLSKGDETQNVALQAGDVLYVPTKGHKFTLNDLGPLLEGIQVVGYSNALAHTPF